MGLEETWCCSSTSARTRERLDTLYPSVSCKERKKKWKKMKKNTPHPSLLTDHDFWMVWDRQFWLFIGIFAVSTGRGKLHFCDGTSLRKSEPRWFSKGVEMKRVSSKCEKSWAESCVMVGTYGWWLIGLIQGIDDFILLIHMRRASLQSW